MTILKSVARPCPICDGRIGEVIHTQTFVLPSGHPLEAGYDVACCPACGFAYADTAASQRDYDAFYAGFSKYGDKATSTGGGGSTEDAARLRKRRIRSPMPFATRVCAWWTSVVPAAGCCAP